MKLYGWGQAPNPRRVLIYLAEKGIEIEVVEAGAGARLSDEYLARYEGRAVPPSRRPGTDASPWSSR